MQVYNYAKKPCEGKMDLEFNQYDAKKIEYYIEYSKYDLKQLQGLEDSLSRFAKKRRCYPKKQFLKFSLSYLILFILLCAFNIGDVDVNELLKETFVLTVLIIIVFLIKLRTERNIELQISEAKVKIKIINKIFLMKKEVLTNVFCDDYNLVRKIITDSVQNKEAQDFEKYLFFTEKELQILNLEIEEGKVSLPNRITAIWAFIAVVVTIGTSQLGEIWKNLNQITTWIEIYVFVIMIVVGVAFFFYTKLKCEKWNKNIVEKKQWIELRKLILEEEIGKNAEKETK